MIYTHDIQHGYLLLHAVWGKGAHEFANMSTPLAMQLMNQFADVAEAFQILGKVMI